eukprot:gene32852-52931_t
MTSHVATGRAKWRGCASAGGVWVCAPLNADVLLVVDPRTGQAAGIHVARLAVGMKSIEGTSKWCGAAAVGPTTVWSGCAAAGGGVVVCAPYNADALLVYDHGADTVRGIATAHVAEGGA